MFVNVLIQAGYDTSIFCDLSADSATDVPELVESFGALELVYHPPHPHQYDGGGVGVETLIVKFIVTTFETLPAKSVACNSQEYALLLRLGKANVPVQAVNHHLVSLIADAGHLTI
ncbi:MAG: hypothetical protein LBU14_05460 [Candidatus Peribacteria bacterium]|nr:hypothetical protein [Candidatus Peribacteria bacterium]